jgi:L-threonylcarbamoyladenylate synthase
VTWVVPASPEVPEWLRGKHDTIAVRVTAHPVAAALCSIIDGALISTSANLMRKSAARSSLRVRQIFDAKLDYILPGHVGGSTKPTEIRDARTNQIIRSA